MPWDYSSDKSIFEEYIHHLSSNLPPDMINYTPKIGIGAVQSINFLRHTSTVDSYVAEVIKSYVANVGWI